MLMTKLAVLGPVPINISPPVATTRKNSLKRAVIGASDFKLPILRTNRGGYITFRYCAHILRIFSDAAPASEDKGLAASNE